MTEQKLRRISLFLSLLAGAMVLLTGFLLLRPLPDRTVRAAPASLGALPEEARLDLNSADREELECLPGVGPVTAEAILTRREELGGFRSREDVLSVPGLGEATYEKLLPYITFEARDTP